VTIINQTTNSIILTNILFSFHVQIDRLPSLTALNELLLVEQERRRLRPKGDTEKVDKIEEDGDGELKSFSSSSDDEDQTKRLNFHLRTEL